MSDKPKQNTIQQILGKMPHLPGIYIMKDEKGKTLYIGKAKVLANRVRSYFQNSQSLPVKTRLFVKKVQDIQFLTTATEQEALILESNFIKKYQPRYNILLKDDKHFPYLKLTTQESFPRLKVVRKVIPDGASYFGPFTQVKEVRETIRLIYKIFPLRQSKDSLDGAPKRRPCLNHQMGRCLAPCAGLVSAENYARIVEDITLFLKGRNKQLVDTLQSRMEKASDELRFEEAATLRDKILAVKTVSDKQKIITTSKIDQDAIACVKDADISFVQVLIVRDGKMIGDRVFKMTTPNNESTKETLLSFIKQYYLEQSELPDEVLLSDPIDDQDLIEKCLSEKKKKRVSLETPHRGHKHGLVKMALENAGFALSRELGKEDIAKKSLDELKSSLRLSHYPERIEGIDISNTSGNQAVGSLVVFEKGLPEKNAYRRYKIKNVHQIDDVAMLREVLTRRLIRLTEEGKSLPQLILIDGGKGHLNAASDIVDSLNLSDKIDLAGVAKGRDRHNLMTDDVFRPNHSSPVIFDTNSPARFLLQRVRDESHRFAIAFHRNLRDKKGLDSPLENIPGIGKKRRMQLLKHFGSLKNIQKASLDEIIKVPKMPKTLAEKIVHTFKQA